MPGCCHDDHCGSTASGTQDRSSHPAWRRVLWMALCVNAAMFGVEVWGGLQAHSASLLADALDFAADAANYGLSLAVLGMALHWRSRAAWFKGASLLAFGVFVLARALWAVWAGQQPQAMTMGAIAVAAMLANGLVAALLYAWRDGDANMHSVWLCTRNDVLGNVAVLLAAVGVFGTGTRWPDLAVAVFMAALGISAGWKVMRLSRVELGGQAAQIRPANAIEPPSSRG
ncbi:cation transporter [Thiomonas bhubaneswarensis]|uniref:Co/Zn/Cd efflux system component n=1 Tax=Thiomonas bhubaneswarensis TaxID=339866 RepID=A0A0K6HZ79_9BURK|nr:cation transporter [Thiomonas bhubaneswarensis]CUA96224.1 Co/Zn/Cd efflux system component [Thiomonas bhubaneswarensis]